MALLEEPISIQEIFVMSGKTEADLFQELRKNILKAAFSAEQNADLYINPKNTYTEPVVFFKTYITIPLWLLVAVLLVILVRNLWGPGFSRKYGIMLSYTILDMLALLSESAMVIIVTAINKDYVIYDYCLLYMIIIEYLPFILLLSSQWLRATLAFQRFVFVYFPLSYKKYFKRTLLVVLFLVISSLNASLCYIRYAQDQWIEKAYAFDKENKELVQVCRVEQPQISAREHEENVKHMDHLFLYIKLVFSEIIPLILMIILSIALVMKIKKQVVFRRQFQKNVTNGGKDEDRIQVVVTITTILSIINIIPLCATYVLCFHTMKISECDIDTASYLEIINNVLKMLNLFLTFFLFAFLSEPFRQLVFNVLRKCRPNRYSNDQSQAVNTESANVNSQ